MIHIFTTGLFLGVSILSFKNCFFFGGAGPSSSRNIPKQLQQQEAGQKNQLFNRHKTQCQHVLIMFDKHVCLFDKHFIGIN